MRVIDIILEAILISVRAGCYSDSFLAAIVDGKGRYLGCFLWGEG